MTEESVEIEGLDDWVPFDQLRSLSKELAHYSCGFLRSRPERWFPNVASQWLTLAHSLGVELKIIEVSPGLHAPDNIGMMFEGKFEGEDVAIAFAADSESEISEAIVPESPQVKTLVLEYIARRLFSSLAMSWNGPEVNKQAIFRGVVAQASQQFLQKQEGGVKVVYSLNGKVSTVWISLGKSLVEQFDGLWRRQVRSASKMPKEGALIQLEVAQLGIPPEELSHYTVPGAVIELETPVSDYITLRVSDRPWLMARLCMVGETFGLEMTSRVATEPADVEGVQRVSIRLGDFDVDLNTLSEGSQAGAILVTSIKADNIVKLYSNNAVIARARLQTYSGSFALTIVES